MGVACAAMSNRFPFNAVFMGGEENTEEVCLGVDVFGVQGKIVVLGPYE